MATIPLQLIPFDVPAVVLGQLPPGRREDGIRAAPQYRLEDLPKETVQELIDEFTKTLWANWEARQAKDNIPLYVRAGGLDVVGRR